MALSVEFLGFPAKLRQMDGNSPAANAKTPDGVTANAKTPDGFVVKFP